MKEVANSKRGRRPAAWMLELARADIERKDEYVDYKTLSERFGVSPRAIEAFCSKLDLSAEYETRGRYAVRVIRFIDLQAAALKYVDNKLSH